MILRAIRLRAIIITALEIMGIMMLILAGFISFTSTSYWGLPFRYCSYIAAGIGGLVLLFKNLIVDLEEKNVR